MAETIHIGRKIGRIRELRGIKQEVLAAELGVSAEAIKNFSEEVLVFHIQNMHDNATAYAYNFQCTYNPLDKVVELYERLLASEREKTELMGNK